MSDAAIPYTPEATSPAEETRASRWEQRFERASDWVNPIVIKECRQALKSRQFFFSFTLTLLFCWLWSIFGVWSNANPYGDLSGQTMLTGYLFILSFPLLVIVPFSAFRSLTVEREDKTFELLAVTTLKPRQIVLGKFVSTLVQLLLYVSGVLPCFGFTALLQGVDLPMMGFLFLNIVLGSISLTMFCLMAASLVQERFWQMLMTVAILCGLLLCFWGGMVALIEIRFDGGFSNLLRDPEFWPAFSGILLAQATWWLVFQQIATSQMTFASDNRSSALRICVVIQHLVYVGWFAYLCWSVSQRRGMDMFRNDEFAYMLLIPSLLYWYCVGAFATGEPEVLSSRVKRQLPESLLGRMFTNWFFPGPGRGYIFAVANYAAACIAVTLLYTLIVPRSSRPNAISDNVIRFMIASFGYLLIYLGLETWILRRVQRRFQASLLLRTLIQVLLLLAGLMVCMFWEMLNRGLNPDSLAYYFSPFHLLPDLAGRNGRYQGGEYVILIVGIGVLALNLPGIIAELLQTKMAAPARVAAEFAAQHPAPLPLPTNPWDDPAEKNPG